MAAPRVALLSPVPLDSPRGNAVTVARIAGGLRARGLDVGVWEADAPGLRDALVTEPPVLIHAFHAHRTGPLALAVARAAAIPLVVTLTGTDVSQDLRAGASRAAVLEVLNAAAAVVAFHGSVATEVEAAAPALRGRVRIVPQSAQLPADDGAAAPAITGEPCILFPAGIRPVKRPLLPLGPLDGVQRAHPGLRLWYAGPALDADEARRLEAALAGRLWARYLGALPHAAMPALLGAADIVLNCSLSEGGMANSVIEALSLGRAVLASDIPGNRSLIEHGVTGLLFDSEASLAEQARRLAGDPALRRRLGETGRRLVAARLGPAREIEGYLEVYAAASGRRLV
ncbi:MAG TPA: glycosyltransferase [Methylomirabilota bacterium]|nr:glycosyltransferase [Methylomirabilota bacterium]